MRQLTSLDAQFLALENNRQTGHVGSLSLYDGELSCASVRELVHERLPLLPPFRYRLAEVPLGLDYPYWVDDPEFDLDFHVRELALPAPGSDAQLAAQVARIHSRPLDRSRPLWELYVIHGIESGQIGLLTKIHHAIIDGLSGAEIMGLLLDLTPEGRDVPDAPETPVNGAPGQVSMLGRGLLGLPKYPARVVRALPSTLPNLEDAPGIFGSIPGAGTVGRVAGAVQKAAGRGAPDRAPKVAAPKTSFNGRLSAHRRFAFGQLDLAEVKAVKNHYGVTVNDVVVTLCATAVRNWLMEHEELPQGPLVAQIPVSVRTGEEMGTFGNRILLMSAALMTDEYDPVRRLQRTHEELMVMKERHKALPAQLLQDANHFIPPAIFSRAAGLTFRAQTSRVGRPNWNLVISNVPGPQIPLYLAGAKLEANYPVSVVTDGMGLNITVMSYMGHLDFGILADRDQMPDLWKLIGWLGDALEELAP
jgi:WS/DGAT/MGAT family acyltransferase